MSEIPRIRRKKGTPRQFNPGESVLDLPKADFLPRLVAHFLDMLLFLVICTPAFFMISLSAVRAAQAPPDSFDPTSYYLWALLLTIPGLVFLLIKDGLSKGQSPGKQAMDVMVVSAVHNRPCSFSESFKRNIILSLTGSVPLVGIFVEVLAMLTNKHWRRWGDRVAKLYVIDVDDFWIEPTAPE